jgi:DNA-binding GntR family transcriptional regulator
VSISNLNPLEKTSLREKVSSALRAAIMAGEMEPGVIYSAPSLGERFGVSATPVREAMIDLVREGLVETVANKGFRVTDMTPRDFDEIIEIRLLLEPPVLRQVTALIPEQDFDQLDRLAQRIVDRAAEGDLVEFMAADSVFHLALVAYANNRRLEALIADLRAHARLYGLETLRRNGTLMNVARSHLTIVDALRSRDADGAERLLADHINDTRTQMAREALVAAAG